MCTQPLMVSYEELGLKKWREVPCGKCLECKNAHQNAWYQRIVSEIDYWKNELGVHNKSLWGTLTYDEDHVPIVKGRTIQKILPMYESSFKERYTLIDKFDLQNDKRYIDNDTGELLTAKDVNDIYDNLPRYSVKLKDTRSLRRLDVRLWLKRCRINYERVVGKDKADKFKYYIIGEYGSKTNRPHYHYLVFGINISDWYKFFISRWIEEFGRQYRVEKIEENFNGLSCYLAKYVSKPSQFKFEQSDEYIHLCEKPRVIASIGFGKHYLEKMTSWHRAEDMYHLPLQERAEICVARLYFAWTRFIYKGKHQRLARYFYDKIFPSYDNPYAFPKNTFFDTYNQQYTCYDLCKKVKKILSDVAERDVDFQLLKLATEFPNRNPFEMLHQHEVRQKEKRVKSYFERMRKFYNNPKNMF